MENLPRDVIYEIANSADDKTIIQFLSINKRFNDPEFFIRVINKRYPLLKEFKKDNESWRQFFVRMTYYIAKLDEEFGIPYIPAQGYNPEYIYKTYKVYGDEKILNMAMRYAGKGGHLDIVEYLIEKGATSFSEAMAYAAWGGHMEIIKFLLKERKEIEFEFDHAMASAAGGGHLDLVQYLIDEKGATAFNYAMATAAYEGHTDIVNYLIDEKGADNFNSAMSSAAEGGHLEIVKLMIEKGKEIGQELDFNIAMYWAAGRGHLDIVKLMIEKGEEIGQEMDFDAAIDLARASGHTEIIEYLKQFV